MFLKFTGLCAIWGMIALSAAYEITPNVIDGVPGFLNITTAPFVKIGAGYYFVESANKKNWFDAYESCRRMEADLITFDSLVEMNQITEYLIDTIVAQNLSLFWSSGTDFAEQDKHVWFSNGQLISSELWLPGEPNNLHNEEHCDNLKINNGLGGLNDDRCEELHYSICEAPQPKTASFIIW
ncbi:C-type lectin 37Da-like isoform X1 [Drosophila elegans]|uniref:C-type lectin 37Da-like isoform X1 n=2 Tax=Drosophila elegans TaxID=30023 RepID=UPI0007E8AAA3|nr:C-type lectin 37Da-like isoform X1 [Drosophila elegans]